MSVARRRLPRGPLPPPGRPKPLTLTAAQVQLVTEVEASQRFMEALADTLLAEPEVTDASVGLAIATTNNQNDAA